VVVDRGARMGEMSTSRHTLAGRANKTPDGWAGGSVKKGETESVRVHLADVDQLMKVGTGQDANFFFLTIVRPACMRSKGVTKDLSLVVWISMTVGKVRE
jgi:hypothetical protein